MLAVLGQNVTSVYTCSLRSSVVYRSKRQVVYHLHGQTSLSTVWVNGTKIQDWLISSPNRVGHLYKSVPFTEKTTYREGLKLVSKMALKKWKKFSFGIFQMFRWSRKFSAETILKVVGSIYFTTGFFATQPQFL